MGSSGGSDVEAGFAKLQGEDFEYYMQTYSIILGRNSKKSTVDVDLSSLGGGMNISRHHARIFYDFQRRRFALEVLGKNGCFVEGVLHLPGNPPVKLDSQDLLQIGDKEFYFLLPVRNILGGPTGPRHPINPNYPVAPAVASGMQPPYHPQPQQHLPPPLVNAYGGGVGRKGFQRGKEYYDEDYEDEVGDEGFKAKKQRRVDGFDGSGYGYGSSGSGGKVLIEKRVDGRLRIDRTDVDNQQLLQLEEKDVVSSVANVLSDLCGPGEWMAMEKLHAELVEHFGNRWHHSRVRRYLTSEEYATAEAKSKPWYGLLMLLRKYPEHFVINTRSKGRVALEFVSLVSLLS
ncbi:unnamed protein product [Cuscuta campestris]|uniref:FHA domain-containing protein n=1 Tax=Cuscuta campestris TaxID=132261 RepID=A0A484NLR1_9ASTE|nr:unnamed protein product [Cuscuta campestris]